MTCGTSPCIYGGDWIRALHPDFPINAINELSVSLSLKAGAHPRVLDYGCREAVRKELEPIGVRRNLSKVDQSGWATPIVPVQKPDGRI